MTKRIKHVSELPVWFDLKNYEFTRTLDSLGWFKQLITRELQLIKAKSLSIEAENELKKFIPLIRANPNLLTDNDTALSLFTLIHSNTPENNNFENYLGVSPIKSKKEALNSTIELCRINYNFSDQFLIERFKKHLAIARKKHKSIYHKPFHHSDFHHWVTLGILPYIDLFIWSLEEKKQITHRVLADALYPYGDKGEETVRKTAIPLVQKIVSPYSMIQLHAQARTTIIERNLR